MLLELLPHLTRLIPAADRFLNTRQEADKAHAAALASMAEEQRSALARVAGEQSALRAEMQQLIAECKHARMEAVSVQDVSQRIAGVENRLAAAVRMMWAVLAMLAMVTAALVVVLVRK